MLVWTVNNSCLVLACMTKNLLIRDILQVFLHDEIPCIQKVLFFTTLVLVITWMNLVPTILQTNMPKSGVWNCTTPVEFFYVEANLHFINPLQQTIRTSPGSGLVFTLGVKTCEKHRIGAWMNVPTKALESKVIHRRVESATSSPTWLIIKVALLLSHVLSVVW